DGAGPGGSRTRRRAAPAAIAAGASPARIVVVTAPVRASIRVMVPDWSVATHTAPAAAARPLGSPPVLTTPWVRPVAGSIRCTVPPRLATHRLPALAAMSLGRPPRALVCATGLVCARVWVGGSIGDKAGSAGSSTHTCPPTATTRLGLVPAGIVAVTARRLGSTRTTRPAPGSVTHTAPDPAATPAGAAGSGTAAPRGPPGGRSARRVSLRAARALAGLTRRAAAS